MPSEDGSRRGQPAAIRTKLVESNRSLTPSKPADYTPSVLAGRFDHGGEDASRPATTPLLSSAVGSITVGRMLADWRLSLAASTAEHATYLGIALARWQRRHNESQYDLSADVTFEIREGHGTILLSGDQPGWLEVALAGQI